MYIYLAKENDFDCIDKNLKCALGELTFTMSIKINKETKLKNLKNQKFHLQLPAEASIETLISKVTQ